jgi:hypothetical protein
MSSYYHTQPADDVELTGEARREAELRMHRGADTDDDRRWTAVEAAEHYPNLTYQQIDLFVAMIHGRSLGVNWTRRVVERHWERELTRYD